MVRAFSLLAATSAPGSLEGPFGDLQELEWLSCVSSFLPACLFFVPSLLVACRLFPVLVLFLLAPTQNGRSVNHVELPPWASDASDFVLKMRQALECP